MKLVFLLSFATAVLCTGQATKPPKKPLAFQVQGTISDQSGNTLPDIEIVFTGAEHNRTIRADGVGAFESSLPVGLYTMQVAVSGDTRYQRPIFRVSKPSEITIDAVLRLIPMCNTSVAPLNESRSDAEAKSAVPALCDQQNVFQSDAPFQVYVRYRNKRRDGDTREYDGATRPVYDPVFLAYNLFAVEADHVTYNPYSGAIRAQGNVVVRDSSKDEYKEEYGDWMTFRLTKGGAKLTGCVCRVGPIRDVQGRLLNPKHH